MNWRWANWGFTSGYWCIGYYLATDNQNVVAAALPVVLLNKPGKIVSV